MSRDGQSDPDRLAAAREAYEHRDWAAAYRGFRDLYGTGPPLTLNGQPATVYGAVIVTVGCPLTSTRGLGAVGIALPPCAQITEAPRWRSGPGIVTPP